MRERAQRYAREKLAPSATAAAYGSAVDLVLAYEADPARVALSRWAVALRSVGVGPQHVRRGFGVRYAEALAAFRSEDAGIGTGGSNGYVPVRRRSRNRCSAGFVASSSARP